MDTIALARELGKSIQQEEAYINLHKIQAEADADTALQTLIGQFNIQRLEINEEQFKKDKDQDKLNQLNTEMREIYSNIMANEHMQAYNDAKGEFDKVMNRVNAIISQSAEGKDPETADYDESCTGSCATCGGCG